MADLRCRYLGFALEHPLVPGASSLADDLDTVRRLQDAGAPMITVRSYLAGPLRPSEEEAALAPRARQVSELYAGFQNPPPFALQAESYGEHLGAIRDAVGPELPLVASLYACELEQWIEGARWLNSSAADALELNVYGLAIRGDHGDEAARRQTLQAVQAVCREVSMPVAVKLLPLYSGLDRFAAELAEAGASGLVLFNGFYRSEMGVERLHNPFLQTLTSPQDPSMRYHWLSRLFGNVNADLAFSGGARTGLHAVKAILCGASAVQLVSVLLKNGPEYLATLRQELSDWLEDHDYEALRPLHGRITVSAFDDQDSFNVAYSNQILFRPS